MVDDDDDDSSSSTSTVWPDDPPPPLRPPHKIDMLGHPIPGEPEHYRLTANPPPRPAYPPETVCFRFRTRQVFTTGARVVNYPHVLLLRVHQSTIAFLAANLLPRFVRPWVESRLPEWFLPDRIVLKTPRMSEDVDEPTKTELMETEFKAYDRLKPLQGLVVPRCFGEACYDGVRALVLEDVGGHSLASPEGALLTPEQLSTMLQECYRALHAFGVHQDDAQLGNFQLVDGKLMALDLEMVEFDVPVGDLQDAMESCIAHLVKDYRRLRMNYRKFDHLLEAA